MARRCSICSSGGDPFEAGEEAGIAAFDGLILSAGPGLCALNIDRYVAAADPSEQDAIRTYLERTQRPQGIAVLREKWRGDLPTSRRRTYVLTTADTLVPPEAQRVMAASVGADVVEIDTDHGPFREQPERLAEMLVDASRSILPTRASGSRVERTWGLHSPLAHPHDGTEEHRGCVHEARPGSWPPSS